MTPLLLALALQAAAAQVQHAACVYWTQPMESRAALDKSGVRHICVPPEQREAWRAAGFDANALTREALRHLVTTSLEGPSEQFLVGAPAVLVGRVEQGDAQLDRAVDGRDRLRLVALPVGLAHAHAAQSLGSDRQVPQPPGLQRHDDASCTSVTPASLASTSA